MTRTYGERLAHEMDRAITNAEKSMNTGILPYPFILGYLLGECSDEDREALSERLARLTSAQELPNG